MVYYDLMLIIITYDIMSYIMIEYNPVFLKSEWFRWTLAVSDGF